jgi:small-conductance mechanosensitive channel
MNEERDNFQPVIEGTPRWMGLAVVALAVLSLVGIGMAWNASSHARDAEQALATQSTQSKTFQQSQEQLTQRLAQAEQTNAQMQGELNLVSDKLKLTQGQVAIARNQVKKERADYTKKLSDVESTLATKASADDVKAIGTDVNGVKTDLDATKGNLQALRGEHGELIARNHEELEQLKRMGERDYFEFTLNGKGQKQHVGSMQVELRGASAKKHQFTVALYVDDMRLEKKNKSINEPIYFYTNGSHQAMELVVNKVADKSVTGYLSMPKNMAASAKAATN